MRPLSVRGVAILGVATLGACADAVNSTDPMASAKVTAEQPHVASGDGASSLLRLANQRTTAHIARGIAMAMDRYDLREGVLIAMRNSPYTEHKLDFHEFISTELGKKVLTVAAEKLGEPIQWLQQEIATLPQLDFYVPVRGSRLTWNGSSDIAVAALYRTGETTVDLYRTDGSAVTWPRQGVAPDFTVFVLHPAEIRSLRLIPARGIAVIQCEDPMRASVRIECDDTGGGGGGGDTGGGGVGVTHGVYIDHFNPQDDDGWGFGDVEVRFTFTFESDGQIVVINRTQEPFVGSEEDILVSARACDAGNSPPHFAVHIQEDDAGLNGGDDEWGTYYFPPFQYNVTNDLWYDDDRKMWLRVKCL